MLSEIQNKQKLELELVLKLSQNKKDLNYFTAALILVSFFSAASSKKNTEKRAAVTSLRSFLFRDDFTVSFKRTVKKIIAWKVKRSVHLIESTE